MTNATTTTTTTATTPSTNLVVGQIVTGVVHKALDYGVLVKVGDEMTLLKDDQFSGGTHSNRKARRKAAALKTEITVEVIDIKAPAEGDKSNRMRIRVSERTLQDAGVLAALKGCSEDEVGSTVDVTVKEVRKDFALVTIADGAAAGYQAILHAINVPGSDRSSRDRFIANLSVGDAITAEVLSIRPDADPRKDLNIALTLVAETKRANQAALESTLADNRAKLGTLGKSVGNFVEVTFGPSNAPIVGYLPSNEVPPAARSVGRCKVKIAGTDGDRIILTRRGM